MTRRAAPPEGRREYDDRGIHRTRTHRQHHRAAAAGDIVAVTVPVKAFPSLPAAPLAGKTVIDTCNYGPEHGRRAHRPLLGFRHRIEGLSAVR